jgi:ribosomal-protein-alanine N-acetyltransferase
MEMEPLKSFVIREATTTDVKTIFAIEHRCFPDPYPMGLLNKLRSIYPNTFLVAENDGAVEGYLIGAVRWRNVGHVLAIGVDPPYRRQGIGTALMKETLERFKDRGAKTVRLEVRKSNLPAQHFYHKLGFRDCHEVPYYYEDGETALAMELNL